MPVPMKKQVIIFIVILISGFTAFYILSFKSRLEHFSDYKSIPATLAFWSPPSSSFPYYESIDRSPEVDSIPRSRSKSASGKRGSSGRNIREYMATMEVEKQGTEEQYFSNINRISFTSANHTPGGNKVVRLNNTKPVGPSLSIKVGAGDTLSMEVFAYYEEYQSEKGLPQGFIVSVVAAAFGVVPGTSGEAGKIFDAISANSQGMGMGALHGRSAEQEGPATYLNYLLFDNNYKLVDAGYVRSTAEAKNAHERLLLDQIVVSTDGYAYVYVTNEGDSPDWVYVDDLLVTQAIPCTVGVDTVVFKHAQLMTDEVKQLEVNHCNVGCVDRQIEQAQLEVWLNLGPDYEYGDSAFQTSVTATIVGFNDPLDGEEVVTHEQNLVITHRAPEQMMLIDFTADYDNIARFEISVRDYQGYEFVKKDIQLTAKRKEKYKVGATNLADTPLVTVNPITFNSSTNQTVFSWEACAEFPNYEFQLLRLYNLSQTELTTYGIMPPAVPLVSDPHQIKTTVNWGKALTIETQSANKTISLHLTEGSGYYIWRVRPIGNLHSNGSSNDFNWGVWSNTGPFGQPSSTFIEVNAEQPPYCFYHNQTEEGINWIYTRTFSEADEGGSVKIKEAMSYANGLMQPKQSQVHLSSQHNVLSSQTIYDFSSRPAISTLAAPIAQDYLKYVNGFAKQSATELYTASSFDTDDRYRNPLPMNAGVVTQYYSNNTPGGDLTIPNAEGFPYSHSLFKRDGSGEVAEQSLPGFTHRIANRPGHTQRTVRNFRAGVSESELLRIFGDEAPNANSVFKRISIDPNQTKNIQYISKEGHVIATCVSTDNDVTRLDKLDESAGATWQINDFLNDAVAINSNGISATKPVAFTVPTTLKVFYNITPRSISAACGSFCATCDYKVYFLLHNLSDPGSEGFPKMDSLIIAGGTCPAQPLGITPFIQYSNLEAGVYLVEKKIFTGNINPQTGVTYIDEAIPAYRATLDQEMLPYLHSVAEYRAQGNLKGLNEYLISSGLPVNEDSTHFVLEASCGQINIPYETCAEKTCVGVDYEKMLIDQWSNDPELNMGTNISEYFKPAWNLTDQVQPGTINALITNMLQDPKTPYTCDQVLNAWQGMVFSFKTNRLQADSTGNKYDPLQTFLLLAGTQQLRGTSSVKNTGTGFNGYTNPGYLSHAYAYFKFNPSTDINENCIALVDAQSASANFDLHYPYPDTARWHWQQLYNCAYNVDPTASTDVEEIAHNIKSICNTQCEARYGGFVQSILTAYRNDKRYAISGESVPLPGQEVITMSAIRCSARTLVENCKSGCSLTMARNASGQLISVGTPEELEAMKQSMTFSYTVALPGENGDCPKDHFMPDGSLSVSLGELLADHLNNILEDYRADHTQPATVDFTTFATQFDPSLEDILKGCLREVLVDPASNDQFYWFVDVRNRCRLRYGHYDDNVKFVGINLCDIPCKLTPSCRSVCFRWVEPLIDPKLAVPVIKVTCEQITLDYINEAVTHQYESIISSALQAFRNQYATDCKNMIDVDTHRINYSLDYYHYTLFYYDRVGNLVRTVPPAGVQFLDLTDPNVLQRKVRPQHTLVTEYDFNSLGQMVRKKTPDTGEQKLFYNLIGQLRFEQDAALKEENAYQYFKFDKLSRPVEVGKSTLEGQAEAFAQHVEEMTYPTSATSEKTVTVFNTPSSAQYDTATHQQFLMNRVSFVYKDEDGNEETKEDRATTHFSYDAHGNVTWLIQELPELGQNRMRYEYDLVSSKMLKVIYNEGKPDQFFHRYRYDEDNRLTSAETSVDNVLWDKDASYSYYAHGPLRRVVYGEDKVQGMDYVYTIQGWLKGMNHPSLDSRHDPGEDGSEENYKTPTDAFGMTLSYFNGDFNRTGSAFNSKTDNQWHLQGTELFDGHISSWTSQTKPTGTGLQYEKLTGFTYRYDVLGRIKDANFHEHTGSDYKKLDDYHSSYTYDANGNFNSLNRNGHAAKGLAMDKLRYTYYPGTNQLKSVKDEAGATPNYTQDLESQTDNINYTYDGAGRLLQDKQNNSTITWNVYDKVRTVAIDSVGTKGDKTLTFGYDAMGHRILKGVKPADGKESTSYYVLDGNGMVMGIYEKKIVDGQSVFVLKEQPIYGSERIGMRKEEIEVKRTQNP